MVINKVTILLFFSINCLFFCCQNSPKVQLPSKKSTAIPPLDSMNRIDTLRSDLFWGWTGEKKARTYTPNRKMGFFNDKMEAVIPFDYFRLPKEFSNFMIAEKEKTGVIDSFNNIVIPFEYDGIYPFVQFTSAWKNKYFRFGIKDKTGLLNGGLMDKTGKILIPAKYNYISYLTKDFFRVTGHNHTSGIANILGEELIPPTYKGIDSLTANLFRVKIKYDNQFQNYRYGCLNDDWNLMLDTIYNYLSLADSKDAIIAQKDSLNIAFDLQGREKFRIQAEVFSSLDNDIYKFGGNENYGLITYNFTKKSPQIYKAVEFCLPNAYKVIRKIDSRRNHNSPFWGLINRKGKPILPNGFKYQDIVVPNEEQIFAMGKVPLYGVYNAKGEEQIPPTFVKIILTEHFTAVAQPNRWKYALLDSSSHFMTDYIYDYIAPTDYGLFAMRNDTIFSMSIHGKEMNFLGTKEFKGLMFRVDYIKEGSTKSAKAAKQLVGAFFRKSVIKDKEVLMQYQFLNEKGGIRTVFFPANNQNPILYQQKFTSTVTYIDSKRARLWLFFEEATDLLEMKNDEQKLLVEELKKMERENFPIEAYEPDFFPEVIGLDKVNLKLEDVDSSAINDFLHFYQIEEELNDQLSPLTDWGFPYLKLKFSTKEIHAIKPNLRNTRIGNIILNGKKWSFQPLMFETNSAAANTWRPYAKLKNIPIFEEQHEKIIRQNLILIMDYRDYRYEVALEKDMPQ